MATQNLVKHFGASRKRYHGRLRKKLDTSQQHQLSFERSFTKHFGFNKYGWSFYARFGRNNWWSYIDINRNNLQEAQR